MIKLVTGSTGTTHVTAADDGALHAAMAGDGLVIFETGSNFAATVVSSTLVRIGDGEGLIDGRHFRIRPSESQELPLSDGVAGYSRNDLIALHYVNSGGVETLALDVLEGEYSEGTAKDPTYTNSSSGILGGATEFYAPLYRLRREGINPPTAEALFTVKMAEGGGAHAKDTDNPHKVTAAQVGIYYVDSLPAAGHAGRIYLVPV